MALQINTTLTTQSGFTVASGSYCWIRADFGHDLDYKVRVQLVFFKDKASYDAKRARFNPVEIPIDSQVLSYTPAEIGSITYLNIHTMVRNFLQSILGASTVTIVQ